MYLSALRIIGREMTIGRVLDLGFSGDADAPVFQIVAIGTQGYERLPTERLGKF